MARKNTSLPSPFLKKISFKDKDCIDFEKYPFNLPFLNKGSFEFKFNKPITIIVGENATGKSTLLEAIAQGCGFNLLGGNKNHTYGHENKESELSKKLRFSWLPKVNKGFFLRAESFFLFADYLEDMRKQSGFAYDGYGGESLHEQSHAESFFSLFSNQFGQSSVIILDEPESALSPMRQLEFLEFLAEMEERNNQVIMVTHSPILMSYKNADLVEIDRDKILPIDYRETKHFAVWEKFIRLSHYV
jgi:predicted ATPase